MTSTERQKYYYQNNLYNNISSINLSEREKILQNKFGIEEHLISQNEKFNFNKEFI